jgi:sporulation integral membrane protein YtvI
MKNLAFIGVFLPSRFARELIGLSKQFGLWSNALLEYIQNVSSQFDFQDMALSGTISNSISKATESLLSKLGDFTALFGSKLLSMATSVPNALFFIVIMFVSAFFMTKDKQQIDVWLKPLFRGSWRENEKVRIIQKDVLGVLWGYLRAQLIMMSLTFLESSIGLWIIGVNYPIPIALGIALIDALPILGPATIYIPWVISKLVMSEYTTALSLFILYLIVTLARQALEPKILSTQIGIYPLITLLAMYIGLKTLGFAGIILGPVSVILLLALFKTGVLPTPAMFELNLERNKNNSDLDDLFF